MRRMYRRLNLIGKQFGQLRVIAPAEDIILRSGIIKTAWVCQCDCGNPQTVVVHTGNLRRGSTLSCGCIRAFLLTIPMEVGGLKPIPFQKGEPSWAHFNCEKMPRGPDHYEWKGDKVGYRTLHNWLRRIKGVPEKCVQCGKQRTTPKSIHWASIDGYYHRDPNDFIALCARCHSRHDRAMRHNQDSHSGCS